MLHFIIGTAGTGKTTRLSEELRQSVAKGKKAILIVPEQFSFEGEKLVYNALGPSLSMEAEVLSFTRLCTSIFRRYGGLAGMEVTQTARYLLMSIVLEELRDTLRVYRKNAANVSFLDTLLAACSECKSAGITPDQLAGFARECEDTVLREKTGELALIYGAYQGMLDRGYADPEDCLIRACAILESENFFRETDVFVDGFAAFMAGERELLRYAMLQSENVWFAMTADSIRDEQGGMGPFSAVKSTMGTLRDMAGRVGISVETPHILGVPFRYSEKELEYISAGFLDPEELPFQEKAEAITLYESHDLYGEAEFISSRIAELVRNGMRYREIAVIARDTEAYLRALALYFGRYGIPYFADDPEDIESKPLIGAALSALDATRGSYDTQAILQLAKSPAMGLDSTAVAELENYCYIWGIKSTLWLEEFTGSPRGLDGGGDDEAKMRLASINETRVRLIEPLQTLREAVRLGEGKAFASGVFQFLTEINAAEHLTEYANHLSQGEREAFLDESVQLWDMVIGILDVFGGVLAGTKMPWARLCELFRLAVGSAELATPPRTLDQVIVGKADRIRPGAVKAVFILGANEGVFPPAVQPGGFFNDAERAVLINAGLQISPPSLAQVALERYFVYFALTLPSQSLTVTYSRSDLHGRERQPSMIVDELRRLFPQRASPAWDDPLSRVAGENTVFPLLCEIYGEDTVLSATLREFFVMRGHGISLEKLDRAAYKPDHRIESRQTAKELFGSSLRLSPTKVERFHRCPYSYYAADGLSLRKRKKVEFSPLESGSLIHHVLHVMVERHGGKGLGQCTAKELEKEIASIIEEYFNTRVQGSQNLPERFRYLFRRLCGMLARLLEHMGKELAQSQFEPVGFEIPIGIGEKIEPLRLETPGGTSVTVEGIIDRLDIMKGKRGNYIRVVDYKSGKKDFKLQDILGGLNMQMLLYLFTIWERGIGDGENALPAGVLYMPAGERYITSSRNSGDEEISAEHKKNLRMSGLLLADEEALRGMESELAGVFIPAKLKKDGTLDAKSSLADLAQMGKLAEAVKKKLAEMGQALSEGKIGSVPMDSTDYPACAYCDYKAVCGFEEGDRVREMAKLDREAVWALLEQNELRVPNSPASSE